MVNLATVLKLTRPLGILDLETTGLDPEVDRIWQISLTKHYPDKDPVKWSTLVHPQVKVTRSASDKFEEINARIESEKPHPFMIWGPKLAPVLLNMDFGGYNVLFDLGFMDAEMKRANVDWAWERNGSKAIDAMKIWNIAWPRNLTNAYKEFVDIAGFTGAHDADADVAATEAVLMGQMLRYTEIPRTINELSEYCFPPIPDAVDKAGKIRWINGESCLTFGKWKNVPLSKVERGYLTWMLSGTFPDDVKRIITDVLEGNMPVKK